MNKVTYESAPQHRTISQSTLQDSQDLGEGGGGGGGGGQGHGLLGWGVKTHLPLRMLSLLLAEVQLLRRRFVP